jgi:cytochrome d ubiquinol oxidase subunit I
MDSALLVHRLHFAFTATFHYLFPQLTMGLALLIVVLKTLALRNNDPVYDQAARFWGRIFGINFVFGVVTGILFGVVTGIPMEFQFGTNWAVFSRFAGGVIGQTLAMEGMFAFFLESAFLGLFLYGEKRLSPRAHWLSAIAVFVGSWLSGYFIIVTDAFMQHPVGYVTAADGSLQLSSFWEFVLNPWAGWQYAHTMCGAAITGAFIMTAVGAFYLLSGKWPAHARIFVKTGVIAGCLFSVLQIFPTGDRQGKMVTELQPVTLAAMEGLFRTQTGAPLVILGQPDEQQGKIDNPIAVPGMLSMLTYRRWNANVRGLDAFRKQDWPGNIPLVYYSYHIMVGLGTCFVAVMALAWLLLSSGKLWHARWMLWVLMLSAPFPYIANTAGWLTAELGRQPWLVYGLMRTENGYSNRVSAGNGMFTLLGFMGIYMALGILGLFLIGHELDHGPSGGPPSASNPDRAAEAE